MKTIQGLILALLTMFSAASNAVVNDLTVLDEGVMFTSTSSAATLCGNTGSTPPGVLVIRYDHVLYRELLTLALLARADPALSFTITYKSVPSPLVDSAPAGAFFVSKFDKCTVNSAYLEFMRIPD